MASIEIRQAFEGSRDDARQKVNALIGEQKTAFSIEGSWSGDEFRFKARQGVTGQIVLSERELLVAVDLPFLLRIFKGAVEAKIKEKLRGF